MKIGTLRQFVDNSTSDAGGKILRVIHAPSDVLKQLPFATEYLAWRETRSLTYCKEEDNSLIGLLRWNDFSNTDAIQWWTMAPHGFGVYFDVHAGSQWIAIAAVHVDSDSSPFDPDLLATADLFLQNFVPTNSLNPELVHPEAMLVSKGMRMSAPPFMSSCTHLFISY